MNRFRAWGLTAALAAGAGAPAATAGEPVPPNTVFNKLFGPKPKPAPAARPATPEQAAAAPLAPEVVASSLRAEQEAWERRMSVCLKLRQVAAESNDDALTRQVDELERQATAVYAARVQALGVPKVRTPEAAATALDRRLGAGVAVTPLTAPAAPVAADSAVRTADASTPVVSAPSRGGRP